VGIEKEASLNRNELYKLNRWEHGGSSPERKDSDHPDSRGIAIRTLKKADRKDRKKGAGVGAAMKIPFERLQTTNKLLPDHRKGPKKSGL